MKYQKPIKLSDPYKDWADCESNLNQIVMKNDSELSSRDFDIIYQKYLPAAAYQEGCYYIEKCANFLAASRSVHESLYPDGFLWWIEHYKTDLGADGILAEAKNTVMQSFWALLSQFELFELTKEDCERVGRDFACSIGPYNSHTVRDIFEALITEHGWEKEAEIWFERFSCSDETSHVRWYAELAWQSRVWAITYGHEFEADVRREAWFHKLHAFNVFASKMQKAVEMTDVEGKSKYNKVISLLQIE